MVRIAIFACLVLVLAPLADAADQARAPMSGAALEKQLRETMDLPADARIMFVGEDGKLLTSDEFAQAMQEGGLSAGIEKDPSGKKLTLRLSKPHVDSAVGPAHVPQLDAISIDGRAVRSADSKGRPTLFNFFFSTCVPCIKEVPILNAFQRKHPEYNYVAVTFDSAAEARAFVDQRKFEWPIVADAKKYVDTVGVKGYPTYMLVAADGRILSRNSGLGMDAMKDPAAGLAHIEEWVASALAGK